MSPGDAWAGGSDETPPESLDVAITSVIVGDLVPTWDAGFSSMVSGVRRGKVHTSESR